MKALLLLALLLAAVWAQCQGSVQLTDTESGIITAYPGSKQIDLKPDNNYSVYVYTLKRRQSSPPKAAVALIGFEANPITGFSFNFFVSQTSQNHVQFVLATPWAVTSWRYIKAGLFASSRQDLQIGSSSFSNLTNGQGQIFVPFNKQLTNPSKSIARPMLSGITLTDISKLISVMLDSISLNSSGVLVGVRSHSNPTDVSFHYLAFNFESAGFVSFGNNFNEQRLSNTTYRSGAGELANLTNAIFGINAFTVKPAQRVGIDSRIDSDFVVGVSPLQDTAVFSLFYIIIGVKPSISCANCNAKLADPNGQCVLTCAPGQVLRNFADGSQGCAVCSPLLNSVASPNGRSCECMRGYVFSNGTCVRNAPQQSFVISNTQTTTTLVATGSNNAQGNAPLRPTFGDASSTTTSTSTQASSTGSLPLVAAGQAGSTQPLTVPPIYQSGATASAASSAPALTVPPISGSASSASSSVSNQPLTTAPLTTAPLTTAPLTVPPIYQSASSSSTNSQPVTVPPIGSSQASTTQPITVAPTQQTVQTNQQIVQGPTQAQVDPCASMPGFYFNGVACVPMSAQASVQQQTVVQTFNPNPNSYGAVTTNTIICPADRVAFGSICVCVPNVFYQDPTGVCQPLNGGCCNSNQVPRQDCGRNGFWNARRGKCVCREGFYWTGNGCASGNECPEKSVRINSTHCACTNSSLIMVNGVCSRCPEGSTWNFTKCVPVCEVGSTWNTTLKKCICDTGYKRVGSRCVPCGANQIGVNEQCLGCPAYSFLSINNCICEDGYQEDRSSGNQVCRSRCPLGSQQDIAAKRCRCTELNYFLQGGVCRPCGVNQISDGIECKLCPSNSVVSGSTCQCKNVNEEVYDKINRVCVRCGENEFPYRGVCASCPINSTLDQAKGRCVCKPGYSRQGGLCLEACPGGILMSSGLCSYCPENTYANQTTQKCECSPGYEKVMGDYCVKKCEKGKYVSRIQSCATCPLNMVFNNQEECVCTGEFTLSSNGTCLPKCGLAQQISETDYSQCMCRPMFYKDVLVPTVCAQCSHGCLRCNSNVDCTSCLLGMSLVKDSFGRGSCSAPSGTVVCNSDQYKSGSSCQNCKQFCESCNDGNSCNRCLQGFYWNNNTLQCEESCGDGSRIILQCDDNNTVSGDGCSSTCQREDGFICEGGNRLQRDFCVPLNGAQGAKPSARVTVNTFNSATTINTQQIINPIVRGANTQVAWQQQQQQQWAQPQPQPQPQPQSAGDLKVSLMGSVINSISSTGFVVHISPQVLYYKQQSGGNPNTQANLSQHMIQLYFSGTQSKKGSCIQNPSVLVYWTCQVIQSPPSNESYQVQLVATNPVTRASSQLSLTVPAARS